MARAPYFAAARKPWRDYSRLSCQIHSETGFLLSEKPVSSVKTGESEKIKKIFKDFLPKRPKFGHLDESNRFLTGLHPLKTLGTKNLLTFWAFGFDIAVTRT